ncbi:DNA polymerase III delta prime subunit [hydrothermal vent metagenome]|uniref:DNA polymerase III delta prime subunit n=1 Tax=hydrothermal vent metagenome TaxID=652676 RepID=A0A3B0U986_9ZZZZ
MRFKDIHGLETTKSLLRSAVKSNHVAHAQLFAGMPGSPALSMALAYATFLNCENPTEEDACGQCGACSKNQKFVHPDVHFIFPVSGTKNVTAKDAKSQLFLKEWRSFLLTTPYGNLQDWSEIYGGEGKQALISTKEKTTIINDLSLKAFEGKFKIMIIWHPELMHKNAANGILKVLEEPPDNSLFLLVSEQPDTLLTTIISRTQRLNIPSFTDQELSEVLTSAHGVESSRAKQLAHLADGSLRTALYLSAQIETDNFNFFKQWMRHCHQRQMGELVDQADEFAKLNKAAQNTFLKYGLSILREALVSISATQDKLFRVEGDEKTFASKFGHAISTDQFQSLSSLISEASYHIERNANSKLLFMNLSINISKVFMKK